MPEPKFLTKEEALQKIKHYAAYQERCHSEIKEKLYSYSLRKTEVEEIISTLISENFLNEERFAIQYASGKFNMKHWGKQKIKYSLKQKQVSDYCIKKALSQIDDDDYQSTLNKLSEQKLKTLKGEKNLFIKKRKLQDFLLQRGFESSLVSEVCKSIR
jgi:regulatory protein